MASLNISRLPNESEADYQRRYCREKMRIYRARKPKGPRRVRGKAKQPISGVVYAPGEWEAMQQRPDETDQDWKRRKDAHKAAKYRARNPELTLQRARDFYAANREAERVRNAVYRAANREKIAASQHRYFLENREKRIGALKVWRNVNPERLEQGRREWREANRALCAAYSASWRRAAREQTPPWADWDAIRAVYEEARRISDETGIPHHVDHIIPLRGRNVRGLHVHTNLQVIPAIENMRKHTKIIEDVLDG